MTMDKQKQLILSHIDKYCEIVLGWDNPIDALGKTRVPRKLLAWGYDIEVNKSLVPIEKAPDKIEFWKLSGEYLKDSRERLQFCKALYYLSTYEPK